VATFVALVGLTEQGVRGAIEIIGGLL